MDGSGPLDRAAAERVLRRASELAGAEPDENLPLGGFDEEVLVDAAVEAGIPAGAVRRAIAIERLGPVPGGHIGDTLVGPTVVIDEQELPGRADDVLARIDRWLVAGHHMRRDRFVTAEASGASAPESSAQRCAPPAMSPGRGSSATSSGSPPRPATPASGRVSCASRRIAIATVRCASPPASPSVAWRRPAWSASPWSPHRSSSSPRRSPVAAGCGLAATGRRRAGRVGRELDRVIDAVDQQVPPARLSVDLARRVRGVPHRA